MPASYGGSSGGASLPDTPAAVLLDAANAGKAIVLDPVTGAGTSLAFDTLVDTGVGILTESAAEGDFVVGDGAGGTQRASVDPAATCTVLGVSRTTTTTYYAADGTAANGAGVDATASVSGTGSSSVVNLAVGLTARNLNSSGIACGTWVSPAIPQGAKRITLYVRTVALTGFTTNGYRFLQTSLRRFGESPPANLLLGAAITDASPATVATGNMRANSNSAPYFPLAVPSNGLLGGTDRWWRVQWDNPAVAMAARAFLNLSTGSTRPVAGWYRINTEAQIQATTAVLTGSPGTGNLQVIIGLESYGSIAGSQTLSIQIELEVET
jgi:hypothetical protein